MADSCVFDMCAQEGNPESQLEMKCSALEAVTAKIYELLGDAAKTINWRQKANCRNLKLLFGVYKILI